MDDNLFHSLVLFLPPFLSLYFTLYLPHSHSTSLIHTLHPFLTLYLPPFLPLYLHSFLPLYLPSFLSFFLFYLCGVEIRPEPGPHIVLRVIHQIHIVVVCCDRVMVIEVKQKDVSK